jgi:O-antigen ligase
MKLFSFLLLSWIVAQTFYFGSYGPDLGPLSAVRPDRVLFVLMAISFAWGWYRHQTVRSKWEWPERLLLIVTTLCVVSFLMSGSLYDDRDGKNKWLNALFNITVFPCATFFWVRALPYRKEFALSVLKVLCWLGAYLSFTAVCEHYEWQSLVWPAYIMDESLGTHFGRARGPFMESVAMGRVLTMVFAAWLVLRLETKPLMQKFAALALVLSLGGIYFTATRGPWLGLGLVLITFLVFESPVRKTVLRLIACIAIAAAVGLSNKFSLGQNNLFFGRQNTVTDRIVTWIVSMDMVKAHPVFGIGFGRFNAQWENYYKPSGGPDALDFDGFDGSHNSWLSIAAEVGLPGLLLYLVMVVLMLRRCLQTYRSLGSEQAFERSFILMTVGLLAAYVLTGWFSDLRWNTVQNTLMFLMLGLVTAIGRDEQTKGREPQDEDAGTAPLQRPDEDVTQSTEDLVGYGISS